MKYQKILITIICLLIIFSTCVLAQDEPENLNVLDRWLVWSNSHNLLELELYKQACVYLDQREVDIAKLETQADWQQRQQKVKDTLMEIVGPFPEKTPLNPQITEIAQRDGYRIEKVIFESMPGYYVSSCLFVPNGITEKTPAILKVSGHSILSFRREAYQQVILNLVKKGFIVFAIDPMGQGERIQYTDEEKTTVGIPIDKPTHEHSFANNQCLLSGSCAARYWIWDGMRAIDYLMTRDEVDTSRIGVTGLSGGGTQTAYIAAFDERVKAAAPAGYICGYRKLLGMIGPQDGEQIFIDGEARGLDHADLIEVFAPKPYLIVATTRDYFNIDGARATFREAGRAYQALGNAENLQITVDDFKHGYTKKNREAVYAFFMKAFQVPGNASEEDVEYLTVEELNVTPTGQIASYLDAETISSVNKSETELLVQNLEENRKQMESHLQRVRAKAKELSGFIAPSGDIQITFRGRYHRDGYSVELYAIHGEGDYVIPILLMVPDGEGSFPAVVYLNPEGKARDAAPGGRIEQIVKQGMIVAAADVIGVGETSIDSDYPGRPSYGAVILGRSIVGIHAGDIVRVVNMLKSKDNVDAAAINAVAYNELCPALLHAAVFEPAIHKTALIGAPLSYQEIVSQRIYCYSLGFQWGVPKALTAYDFPDLIGCVAPRKLLLADLNDCKKESASAQLVKREYTFPRAVYAQTGVSGNLKVEKWTADRNINEIIEWLVK
ncbi:acetylxylan esterase [candidate division KSB1 bacterium]|nr:acetylxylan esterase [candidate division KSB1 bacterium]